MSGAWGVLCVGAMIQKVPHKCKFSKYGCDVQMKLKDLVQHEKRCPDDACGKEVQIKKSDVSFSSYEPRASFQR